MSLLIVLILLLLAYPVGTALVVAGRPSVRVFSVVGIVESIACGLAFLYVLVCLSVYLTCSFDPVRIVLGLALCESVAILYLLNQIRKSDGRANLAPDRTAWIQEAIVLAGLGVLLILLIVMPYRDYWVSPDIDSAPHEYVTVLIKYGGTYPIVAPYLNDHTVWYTLPPAPPLVTALLSSISNVPISRVFLTAGAFLYILVILRLALRLWRRYSWWACIPVVVAAAMEPQAFMNYADGSMTRMPALLFLAGILLALSDGQQGALPLDDAAQNAGPVVIARRRPLPTKQSHPGTAEIASAQEPRLFRTCHFERSEKSPRAVQNLSFRAEREISHADMRDFSSPKTLVEMTGSVVPHPAPRDGHLAMTERPQTNTRHKQLAQLVAAGLIGLEIAGVGFTHQREFMLLAFTLALWWLYTLLRHRKLNATVTIALAVAFVLMSPFVIPTLVYLLGHRDALFFTFSPSPVSYAWPAVLLEPRFVLALLGLLILTFRKVTAYSIHTALALGGVALPVLATVYQSFWILPQGLYQAGFVVNLPILLAGAMGLVGQTGEARKPSRPCCHSERSEESPGDAEVLRSAQNDELLVSRGGVDQFVNAPCESPVGEVGSGELFRRKKRLLNWKAVVGGLIAVLATVWLIFSFSVYRYTTMYPAPGDNEALTWLRDHTSYSNTLVLNYALFELSASHAEAMAQERQNSDGIDRYSLAGFDYATHFAPVLSERRAVFESTNRFGAGIFKWPKENHPLDLAALDYAYFHPDDPRSERVMRQAGITHVYVATTTYDYLQARYAKAKYLEPVYVSKTGREWMGWAPTATQWPKGLFERLQLIWGTRAPAGDSQGRHAAIYRLK